ncbi:nucleoporin NUP42 isoform X2 [Tachysurus fulvidraco]|uniref:nucleoporin NUP42 isoform X2 n=1 Tax=Tachysurus fulvidraco TaxID=1234273 RepID=UPI001FF0643A|nr:nucleoporin NUP42 isoform X2 [Tachysurus fulvidraco]
MTVCSYFLEGRCRYGDKCWNEHPRGGRHAGSVNRVWVNPTQRSGGGVVQPSSFSRGGGDWGRGNSGAGRDDRSSNFSFTTQNRFSNLSNTQSGYRRTGGGGGGGGGGDGGGDDTDKQLDMIQKDMEVWQSSGQWLFSCYAILKASITGFVELSPEELRMEYYTSRATGDLQSFVNSVQQLANQWRSRVQELRAMSPNTRASMIAELSNPGAQTPSGGELFSSSSSSSSGFGAPTTSGFGAPTTSGFGAPTTSGFGAPTTSGFGAPTTSGFGAPTTSGFGSSSSGFGEGGFGSSAAGFSFSASNPGFGSSGSQTGSSQFGSSAPSASTFSFADPAGATASKSSAAGFSFSSASAGGFGSSSPAPGGGASVSAGDRKSAGDSPYTPLSELTPDELREFTAKRFTLGQIPLRPPPAELLTV